MSPNKFILLCTLTFIALACDKINEREQSDTSSVEILSQMNVLESTFGCANGVAFEKYVGACGVVKDANLAWGKGHLKNLIKTSSDAIIARKECRNLGYTTSAIHNLLYIV